MYPTSGPTSSPEFLETWMESSATCRIFRVWAATVQDVEQDVNR